ncbi:MAG: hypothetical protein ISS57_17110 [Anaerolineales bacterium]|nr:hypothetical protein [Anaerolineales bacterium]
MYQISMAIAGYAEVSAEVLDLAREHAFAIGESTVCINAEYAFSNLDAELGDPESSEGASGEFRELLIKAKRMGICDLMLSE